VKFALNTPNFGTFADPRTLADLAREAEEAGWDGFFLWDHMLTRPGVPVGDPWVQLAAMAMRTSHIRIGPMVTPLPRRRPWKLARETVTLDHLSGGRLILGLGIGDDFWREYSAFSEDDDPRRRGRELDEGLQVLTGLWSGEPFNFEGKYFNIKDAQFLPRPVQQPRIPIWLAGRWPGRRPFVRAAAWDGVIPIGSDSGMTPDECRAVVDFIRANQPERRDFDVAVVEWQGGTATRPGAVEEFAAAGATWYQLGFGGSVLLDDVRQRIQEGPPS
jgi:alkanesulfonate monooxygenase SsuD/methylene tetrahydromethanopterin reductase-like flavin-dependent oxidoreductase (luciferase family)